MLKARLKMIVAAVGVLCACVLALRGAAGQGDAASAVAETERDFARTSVAVGQREAFLQFFAGDGVVFNPGPVNGREFYRGRPPTPKPQVRILDWEPAVLDVAVSEDLAYSTGPFAVTEAAGGKRLAEGWFFSVWRQERRGTWRVAADLGVPVKDVGPLRPRAVEAATPPGAAAQSGEVLEPLESLRRVDTSLAGVLARGDAVGYLPYVTSRSRVYRRARPPAVGPVAIRRLLEAVPGARCRGAGAGMSKARDFGYFYGTCETAAGTAAEPRRGGFLRVWRRIEWGWVLGAEVVAIPES